MKKSILFLMLSILCQCQQRHNYTLQKDNIKPKLTELQKKIDIKGNYINIFFEGNFINEKTIVLCDSKEIYRKDITTDNTINLADSFSQKYPCNNLYINIMNQKIILNRKDINSYKYLYINNNKNDSLNLILSNVPKVYY